MHHLHHILLVSICFVGYSSALICNACDNWVSCNNPFPESCPPHSKCYTLTKHNGNEVISKGCAHSCDNLPFKEGSFCTTCHHTDFCNDRGHAIGRGVQVIQRDAPGIGGGVVVDNGYHIGGGVRPMSAAHFSATGSILSLAIFKYFL